MQIGFGCDSMGNIDITECGRQIARMSLIEAKYALLMLSDCVEVQESIFGTITIPKWVLDGKDKIHTDLLNWKQKMLEGAKEIKDKEGENG